MSQRRGKYNARKTKIDGYTLDSRAEARRYRALKLMVSAGEIAFLVVHPRFTIHDAYIDRNGNKVAKIEYVGDFRYRNGQTKVVEDVKGVETAVFKLKAKMFKRYYPQFDFRIIPAKDVE